MLFSPMSSSIRGILFTDLSSHNAADKSLYVGPPSFVRGLFWNNPHGCAHDMARVKMTGGAIFRMTVDGL